MTPEARSADILKRCWWQEERDGPRPVFNGLDTEIAEAIRAAVAEERDRMAEVCLAAEPFIGKDWAKTLASECRRNVQPHPGIESRLRGK